MKLHEFTRRYATIVDRELLFQIHRRAMREHILAAFGSFDEAEQWAMFFRTPPEKHEMLLDDFAAIGFWVVNRSVDQIELARISILPEYQGIGIGTGLVRELMSDATLNSIPVRLRVFKTSRAQKLYRLLGFREERRSEHHVHMVFRDD